MRTESANGAKYTPVILVKSLSSDMLTTLQVEAMADRSRGTILRATASGILTAYGQEESHGAAKATIRRNHYYKTQDIHRWIADGCPTQREIPVAAEPAAPTADLQATIVEMHGTLMKLAEGIQLLVRELGGK